MHSMTKYFVVCFWPIEFLFFFFFNKTEEKVNYTAVSKVLLREVSSHGIFLQCYIPEMLYNRKNILEFW